MSNFSFPFVFFLKESSDPAYNLKGVAISSGPG